ncbi:MAG: protein kinase [Acidobacteriia bacterium]|nr:protein kinase [Terriglobia bacterium]
MINDRPGTRIGPYEIVAPLGAGGMGAVYRARDTRLGRDVAVKVLPPEFTADPDRLRRFEQEARAAGALNHPNVLSVFDVGQDGGAPYLVTELLEGQTLRERLKGGALPVRRAIEIGVQIAKGLAAAHEKGIVHRDLKPENVFLTKDGHVKILDFGLAKIGGPFLKESGKTLTTPPEGATGLGVVLGTAGYMAPEQVRGLPADPRSDIFAFGAVLYEMLSGQRAFGGDSAADTMSAILREEPPDLSAAARSIPPGLERIVRHCLEKDAETRFRSAHDLAFDLETLSNISETSAGSPARTSRSRRYPWRAVVAVGAGGVLVLTASASYVMGRRLERQSRPGGVVFRPLSYRQEPIFNARLVPDGKTILYSAAPLGNRPGVFSVHVGVPGATPLGPPDLELLAVSNQGELAVLTHARYVAHSVFEGTLARMSLDAGAPREILDRVREADWAPDAKELTVIREVNGTDNLEFPAGKVLYRSGGYLSNPRFSPSGDRIAFFEHPFKWDDRGLVAVVDLTGKKTVLSEGYWGEEGLAWSRDGTEVLFSAGTAYNNFKVYAVDLAGHRREALASAGGLTIQDVADDGRLLVTRDDILQRMPVLLPGATAERDLSWLDFSQPAALSPDGQALLFGEESGSLGNNYAVCLRQIDGSPVVRLGEGFGQDLSRDGKWALSIVPTSPPKLAIYPTGAGETRLLPRGPIANYYSARFFPDAQRVLACGHEEGHAVRCYVQAVSGGEPRPVTPEGTSEGIVSPDGTLIVVKHSVDGWRLYPADGGSPRTVPGATSMESVVRWSADGRSLLLFDPSAVPARVERLDLDSGRRRPVRTLGPQELAGVLGIGPILMTENEQTYAYGTNMMISHLFIAEGMR